MQRQYRIWDIQAHEYDPNVIFDQKGTFFRVASDFNCTCCASIYKASQEGRYLVEYSDGYPDSSDNNNEKE